MKASIIQKFFKAANDDGGSVNNNLRETQSQLYNQKLHPDLNHVKEKNPKERQPSTEVHYKTIKCPALAHEYRSIEQPPVIVDSHKVFIQFTDLDLTERKMARIFEQFGSVKNSFFLKGKRGQTYRSGFIIFYEPQSAQSATMARRLVHNGCQILIKKGHDKKATRQWVRTNDQFHIEKAPKTECTCTSSRLKLCSANKVIKGIEGNHIFEGDFRFNEVQNNTYQPCKKHQVYFNN